MKRVTECLLGISKRPLSFSLMVSQPSIHLRFALPFSQNNNRNNDKTTKKTDSIQFMDYTQFVHYTIICSIVSLDRVSMRKKVLNAPEVLEVVSDFPVYETYMNSLYNCQYSSLFTSLGRILLFS